MYLYWINPSSPYRLLQSLVSRTASSGGKGEWKGKWCIPGAWGVIRCLGRHWQYNLTMYASIWVCGPQILFQLENLTNIFVKVTRTSLKCGSYHHTLTRQRLIHSSEKNIKDIFFKFEANTELCCLVLLIPGNIYTWDYNTIYAVNLCGQSATFAEAVGLWHPHISSRDSKSLNLDLF